MRKIPKIGKTYYNLIAISMLITLSIQLINPNFCIWLPHQHSTTVSFEANPLTHQLTSKLGSAE